MRANRRKNTGPERALRSELHRRGLRFRVDLPVDVGVGRRPRPDLVFPKRRVVVFVDGCFWHGCPEHGELPASNQEFWRRKFQTNRERDRRTDIRLQDAGWSVVRIWEHDPVAEAADRVEAFVYEASLS